MMAFDLKTEIEIDAPAERVWAILTDFAAYPAWNPFVVRAEGELVPNGRLAVSVRPPGGKAMRFKPRVTRFDAGKRFSWLGNVLVPGLFDGEHQFEVVPLGPDKVRFVHAEHFTGLLVPLLKKTLDQHTRGGFEAMNQALKARAETAS